MKRILVSLLRTPGFWMLALMVMPELSYAASITDGSIFTIPAGDLSKQYLDRLFPADGVSSPFSAIMQVLNSSVLLLGGVMTAWIATHNVMATASTGEFSKKLGGMWMPIRIAGSASLMMPIKGGICAATYLVVWVFSNSIGLGDTIYNTWMQNNSSLVFATAPVDHEKTQALMLDMLKMSVCTASLEKANNQSSLKYFTSNGSAPAFGVSKTDTDSLLILSYGNSSDPTQVSACGQVILNAPTDTVQTNMASDNPQVQALTEVQNAVWAQKKIALMQAADTLGKDASAYVFTHSNVLPGVGKAISDYQASVLTAVVKEATSNSILQKVAQAQTKQGWIVIGATYLHQVQFQQSLSQIGGSLPSVSADTGKNTITDDITKFDLASLDQQIKTEIADPSSAGLDQAAAMDQQDPGGFMNLGFIHDPMGYIAKRMMYNFSQGNFFSGSTSTSPNMLLTAAAIGGKCLDLADFLLIIPIGVAVFAAPFAIPVMGITLPIAGSLIVFGIGLQNFLPMEPYILWIGVVLSIFTAFIEAAFASSLWMLAHMMHGSSEEAGAGEQGYKLLLSLFLSIPLSVIAFCVSMTLLQIGSDYVNATVADAFDMTRGNEVNVWGTLGILAVYLSIMLAVVKICFSEIFYFADRVSNWLGIRMQSISGHAQEVRQHAGQHNTEIVAGVIAAKQGAVKGSAGDLKDANEKSKQRKQQGDLTKIGESERTYNATEKSSKTQSDQKQTPTEK